MKCISALFDTNVVVDYIEKRIPFAIAADRLFQFCMDEIIKGFVTTQSIADIFYILRKDYTAGQRRKLLNDVCEVLEIADIGKRHVLPALFDDIFPDLEDAILAKCAEDYGVDYIVSRDPQGFTASKVPVVTPSELLDKIGQ